MQSYATAILSIFLFATYPTISKTLVAENHPLIVVAASNLLCAAVILFLFGAFTEAKKIIRAKRLDIWLLALSVFAGVLGPTLQLRGLAHSSVVSAVLFLSFTSPIAALLSHWFLREKLRSSHITGFLLLIFGMMVYSTDGFSEPFQWQANDLFFLGAAGAFAASDIVYKKKLSHLSQELVVLTRNLFGGFFVLLLIPVFSLEVPIALSLTAHTAVELFLLVTLSILLAQALWYTALERLKVRDAVLLDALYPVFSAIIAFIVLDERITPMQMFGGFIMVAGLLGSQFHHYFAHLHADHHERKKHMKLRGFRQ